MEHGGEAQKLRIVAESELAGAVPAAVARQYDISTGLLYTWKRMAPGSAACSAESVALVPVHVAEPAPPPRGRSLRAARLDRPAGRSGWKWDCGVDPEALVVTVGLLQRR